MFPVPDRLECVRVNRIATCRLSVHQFRKYSMLTCCIELTVSFAVDLCGVLIAGFLVSCRLLSVYIRVCCNAVRLIHNPGSVRNLLI